MSRILEGSSTTHRLGICPEAPQVVAQISSHPTEQDVSRCPFKSGKSPVGAIPVARRDSDCQIGLSPAGIDPQILR